MGGDNGRFECCGGESSDCIVGISLATRCGGGELACRLLWRSEGAAASIVTAQTEKRLARESRERTRKRPLLTNIRQVQFGKREDKFVDENRTHSRFFACFAGSFLLAFTI